MTKFARWYYLASFITVLIFFVGAGLIWQSYSSAAILGAGDVNNVFGWAWTGNTGWVSLNYKNCVDLNDTTDPDPCQTASPPVEYGLRLVVNNEGTGGVITGYAWSENLGWICFGDGQGDDSKGCLGTPPIAPADLAVTFTCKKLGVTVPCDEVTSAFINGWAKIVSLGDAGWIKLSEDFGTRVVFGETSASTKLDGYMWHYAGGSTLASAYGVGWICFGDPVQPQRCNTSQEVLFPYLRAEGGDVFSKGNIRTFFPAPEDIGNAQFLIHVQGTTISRFRSSLEIDSAAAALCSVGSVCRKLNYSLITNSIDPSREEDEPYNFKLGRFDFAGLSTVTNFSTGENKYGDTVVEGAAYLNLTLPLDNSVYFIDNDYTISSNPTIPNGNDVKGGAGTVIIKGNLNINSNINYDSAAVDSRQKLASVAWIVLGDVYIAPLVTKVVGSFIVYGKLGADEGNVCDGGGNDGTSCTTNGECTSGGTCQHICAAKQANGELYNGCGKFVTGDPDPAADNSQKQLEVSGTVFARQFILLRNYINVITREAAEKFIADGRIQLNSPPGLSDFAKGLPTFRR